MWGVNTDDEDNLIQNAFDNIGNEDSDIVSSKDIDFVFECMAKEAPFDKQSIKQIFYGMVSAFTKVVIHHAISSKNAGAGKTYLLVLVAGYMPRQYVIPLNGMSDKAMLHKAGSMVVEMEDGEIKLLDALIDAIEEDKDKIQEELDYTLNNGNKEDIKRLKKSLKDKDNEIKDLKSKAEKLIILENRIVLLLDTTQDGVFSALMSMASQDTKEDQKYEFVDSNGSTIGTRSNRFRGNTFNIHLPGY